MIISFLSYGIISFLPAEDEQNLALSYLVITVLSLLIMLLIYRMNKRNPERLYS